MGNFHQFSTSYVRLLEANLDTQKNWVGQDEVSIDH